ncbi:hypothetical protein [Saccharopolyspora rosea]|uniref:Uncharacterized protein n=1 Tax=Saccharopolyspora rosea TaxID=524884 RepID=A0ABW3FRM3_9PSEU|nr:hypothetical protein [Saccharopolyspora rosea]
MSVEEYIEEMANGYAECLLWQATYVAEHDKDCTRTECECDRTEMADHFTAADFSDDLWDQIKAECKDFFDSNWRDLGDIDAQQAGHDFLLTRQRHGTGFWDRGLGDKGDRLTESAKVYGEHNIEVEDGFVYSVD